MFVPSQWHAATTFSCRIFSSFPSLLPPKSCIPQKSHISPLPSATAATRSLSLWICLLQTFHINGSMQQLAFCIRLLSLSRLSRSVYVTASLSMPFYSILYLFYRYQFRDFELCPLFGSLNNAAMHKFSCEYMCFQFFWVYAYEWNCWVVW